VHDLHHAYGDGPPVLEGVSFGVHPGEVVAVLGPSGAGKTTLFRCASAVVHPSQDGRVEIDGAIWLGSRPGNCALARQSLGLVYQ
jgi:putative ABC transport system ATP-binding protein